MLKSSTCGFYVLWIGIKPEGGRELAELYLIRLPSPTGDQRTTFEQSSTRLEVSLPLEDISYAAFSEEGGLLALTLERERKIVHLFYY